MAELSAKIKEDTLAAMKAGDPVRLATLRLLAAALHNREIEKRSAGRAGPLTDDEVVETIRREAKKRREAIELYTKGGRRELADKESGELGVLEAYLPPALDEAAVRRIAAEAVAEVKPAGPRDFGKVMGAAMKKAAGRAEAGTVAAAVKAAMGQE